MNWSKRKVNLQMSALVEAGRSDGFDVMVLALPAREEERFDDYSWLAGEGGWRFEPGKSEFEKWEDPALYFETDFHYSPKGNTLLAEQLYNEIIGRGF